MRQTSTTTVFLVLGAFLAGFLSHLLYLRWTSPPQRERGYPVTFSPLPPLPKVRQKFRWWRQQSWKRSGRSLGIAPESEGGSIGLATRWSCQ